MSKFHFLVEPDQLRMHMSEMINKDSALILGIIDLYAAFLVKEGKFILKSIKQGGKLFATGIIIEIDLIIHSYMAEKNYVAVKIGGKGLSREPFQFIFRMTVEKHIAGAGGDVTLLVEGKAGVKGIKGDYTGSFIALFNIVIVVLGILVFAIENGVFGYVRSKEMLLPILIAENDLGLNISAPRVLDSVKGAVVMITHKNYHGLARGL